MHLRSQIATSSGGHGSHFLVGTMQHDNAMGSGYIPERESSNLFHEPLIRTDACILRETFRS